MDGRKIVNLETLGASDLDHVVRLLVDSFYSMFQSISKDREDLARFFKASLRRELCYVLLSEGNIAGMIAVSDCEKRAVNIDKLICMDIFGKSKGRIMAWQLERIMGLPAVHDRESGYIDFLATAPEFRRTGVGNRLLTFAEEKFGFRYLYLDVLADNMPAVSLYNKLGFVKETEKSGLLMRLAGIKAMYIMKKQLEQRK